MFRCSIEHTRLKYSNTSSLASICAWNQQNVASVSDDDNDDHDRSSEIAYMKAKHLSGRHLDDASRCTPSRGQRSSYSIDATSIELQLRTKRAILLINKVGVAVLPEAIEVDAHRYVNAYTRA